MENENFQLYLVNTKYIRNLMNIEKRLSKDDRCNTILSNSPQKNKHGRPYLGIIIFANNRKYCIPLSSVGEKEKYKSISENITIRKIRDENEKVIGVLNINNMIPVRDEYIELIDLTISPADEPKLIASKKFCQKELTWCNEHRKEIEKLANDLHKIICSDTPFSKRSICPHYDLLEKECDKAKPIPKRAAKKKQKRERHNRSVLPQ